MDKKFTMKNSLHEILTEAREGINLFFPKEMLLFFPEKYHTLPMEEWVKDFRMPWGAPFDGEALLEDANRLEDAGALRPRKELEELLRSYL